MAETDNPIEPQRTILMGTRNRSRNGNPAVAEPVAITPERALLMDLAACTTLTTAIAALSTAVVAAIAAPAGTVMHLSGSTSGRPKKVTGTNSAGAVTVHTAISGSTQFDYIYLFANNTDSTARLLTLEWGGTTSPDDLITVTIPAQHGLYVLTEGHKLNGGLAIKAFAASANVINISGWVVRK